MALPSKLTLAEALSEARTSWRQIKQYAVGHAAQLNAASVPANYVLECADNLQGAKARLQAVISTPGLAAYAQQEYAAAGYDVVADYNAMVVALDACIAWVKTNFPKDANGFLLAQTFAQNSPDRVYRNFTQVQVAQLVALLNTLSATIE